MSRLHVIVIGLGAVGSATALHLARAGASVVGIDRWRPPHRVGSTHGESRITRATAWEGDAYVPLVARAQALWREFERETGRPYFMRCGGLFVGYPDEYHVAGSLGSAQRCGLAYELLDGAQITARWPWLNVRPDMVGFFDPAAGVLAPERIVEDQLRAAASGGARVLFDTDVLGVEPSGAGVTVATSVGPQHADVAIVCAGGWTSAVLGAAIPALPVERVTQHWFAEPTEAPPRTDAPVLLLSDGHDHATAVFPAQGCRIKVAGHGSGIVGPLDALDRDVHADDIASAGSLLRDYLPRHAGAHLESSSCFYTRTPDGQFLIDRLPDAPQVIVASACNGFGFKFSVAVGESLAKLALGETPPVDIAPWRLPQR